LHMTDTKKRERMMPRRALFFGPLLDIARFTNESNGGTRAKGTCRIPMSNILNSIRLPLLSAQVAAVRRRFLIRRKSLSSGQR
jgi:hypothetical protein